MATEAPPSQLKLALELSKKLLDDLDRDKVSTSTAIQRLSRIASLLGDEDVVSRTKKELDGFSLWGLDREDLRDFVQNQVEQGRWQSTADINATTERILRDCPAYRIVSLPYYYGNGFATVRLHDSIVFYEELLDRVRKEYKTAFTLTLRNDLTVRWSAQQLNKVVFGARRWVYEEGSRLAFLTEFGQIPSNALSNTFYFVDKQLLKLVPSAAERLVVAYKNLAEKNQENWENVVDTCRRVIKDFADAVFPARDELVDGMAVSEEKYLNRIRIFVRQSIDSRRQRLHSDALLQVLGELLVRTDNLASRSVHSGKVSQFEAERVLIYTYLTIGDILVLSGYSKRLEANEQRISLNSATGDDLRVALKLSSAVTSEIIRIRKHGSFRSWDDVASIKGIGSKTLERLRKEASL